MRILFYVYNTIDSCSFYRSGGVAKDITRQTGYEIEVRSLKDSVFHWQTLLKYDLVMMQRPYNNDAYTMGVYIKKLGIPLWIDHDDNLLVLPRENRMASIMTKKAKNIFREMLQLADAVSVTTDVMAEEFKEYNSNIHVIPNAHNDMIFGTERSKKKRNDLILWRGSDTHVRDIMLYADEISIAINNYPSHKFVFAGFDPWMVDLQDNLEVLPTTDPLLYFETMLRLAPKLLHVPLQNTLFNRCKSNIAWMEATYFGAVCLAPMIEEWIKPGALNYDNGNDYYEWISSAIKGEIDLEKYVNISWDYIYDNLLLSNVNRKRIDLINSLVK
jgi:hypothetical protein